MRKTPDTSFKISYSGGEYLVPTDNAQDEWIKITKANGLDYVDFDQEDKANWYGTMGPYLDMFSAYSQRTNELRLGHNNSQLLSLMGYTKVSPFQSMASQVLTTYYSKALHSHLKGDPQSFRVWPFCFFTLLVKKQKASFIAFYLRWC
ncbi:unnamed protein product [Arctia plantaginis]|uniref:Uncharacterized protein n=1 Tax=Arctia plantaginis TaxID=874455 RepID=A0A8S1BKV9_ARCPL|nr:unnamed protein product [Arctia plantaginis]